MQYLSSICLRKEIPLAILMLCILFLLLRSTTFGTGLAYTLRAFLIFSTCSPQKIIPRFPKIVVLLLVASILWISIIMMRSTNVIRVSNNASSTPTPAPIVYAVTTNSELDLMVRSSPSIDSKIIDRYAPNTKFIVECFTNGTEVSDGIIVSSIWYKVYGHNEWVSSVYVSTSRDVLPC